MPKGSNYPKRVWRKGCLPDVTVKDNPDQTKIITADSPEVELLGIEWFENPLCKIEKPAPTAEDLANVAALVESKDAEIERLKAQLAASTANAMKANPMTEIKEELKSKASAMEEKLRAESAEFEAKSKAPRK